MGPHRYRRGEAWRVSTINHDVRTRSRPEACADGWRTSYRKKSWNDSLMYILETGRGGGGGGGGPCLGPFHVPHPSNHQKVSRAIRFQYVLTMVLRPGPESKSGIPSPQRLRWGGGGEGQTFKLNGSNIRGWPVLLKRVMGSDGFVSPEPFYIRV